MNQIEPYGLWVGHAGDGRAYQEAADRGIRAIVQVAITEPPLQPPREFVYCRISFAGRMWQRSGYAATRHRKHSDFDPAKNSNAGVLCYGHEPLPSHYRRRNRKSRTPRFRRLLEAGNEVPGGRCVAGAVG